ncbi:MAG: hypothetical protein WA058_01425 [Minisyncoccia bacterium]
MNNTMTNPSDIERIVMRRVHLIRILGLIISTAVLAVFATIAALWGIGKEVWVARIFENAPSRIGDLPNFFIAAFFHTNILVQALVVLTLVSLIYLVREMVRFVMNASAPTH